MKQRCQSALYKIIFLRTPSSLTPCCAPSLVSAPWPEFEAPSTLAPSRPRRLLPPPPPPHCTPTVLFTRHHHTRNFHSLAFWLQCPPSHFLSHKLPFILQIWLRSVETVCGDFWLFLAESPSLCNTSLQHLWKNVSHSVVFTLTTQKRTYLPSLGQGWPQSTDSLSTWSPFPSFFNGPSFSHPLFQL